MKRTIKIIGNRNGTVIVFVALTLSALIGIAALAVDVGYMMVARNELQNVADAGALAAARRLGHIYEGMGYSQQQTYNASGDAAVIEEAAIDVAAKNKAAGKAVTINAAEVIIGTWNPTVTPKFTATMSQPDAVRVTTRRDSTANGPIGTFFARVLGVNTVNVSATATAALTGETTIAPGGLPLPVGISMAWFNKPSSQWCNQPIKFYPTGTIDGCAGWNTYEESPPNASTLKKLLHDLATGAYTSPAVTAGQTSLEFTGGTVASAFSNMTDLFNVMRIKNDGVLDQDTNPLTWTATVPVYNWADCSNPNKNILIVGFTTAVITQVLEAPAKTIQATVLCDNVESGRGGGTYYGNKGSIPGLVQ